MRPIQNGSIAVFGGKSGSMTSNEIHALDQAERDSQEGTEITSVGHRVINAVAEESNKSVSELEPLYYSIDPDALNSLFENASGQTVNQLRFTFSGHQVTVDGDGSVGIVTDESRNPNG